MEKRTLVTDLAELREGDKIVLVGCAVCGPTSEHGGIVIGDGKANVPLFDHDLKPMGVAMASKEVVPMPPCLARLRWRKTHFVVSTQCVARRVVYRIDTGIDLADDAFEDELDRMASRVYADGVAELRRSGRSQRVK